MIIRPYNPGEESSLYQVFYTSIHSNARTFYSQEQLNAWAPEEYNPERWTRRMAGLTPFVIEENGFILGYGDLQDSGLIDHFFIRGGQAGQGLGGRLMTHILKEAHRKKIRLISSHVSLAAQPFFEKYGFLIIKRNNVIIRGITLKNALMHKAI